jgi:hypothetical protein
LSSDVLVVREPERGTLLSTGPDAIAWLNGLLTCDVAALQPEQGVYGLLLNKQGKIQSDLTLLATQAGLLLSVAPGSAPSLLGLLDRFLVMEDATIADVSADWEWARFFGGGALGSARAAAAALGGVAASVVWTHGEGAALAMPSARSSALSHWLESASGVHLADAQEWDAFRVAHGLGRFGVDFSDEDNPHEAGLDRLAISWSKGCYLGQEVVCMQDMRGKLKRRLVALAIDDAPAPAIGAKVTAGAGAEVGEVTSSVRADSRAWALARLKSPYFEGHESIWVEGHAARVAAAG